MIVPVNNHTFSCYHTFEKVFSVYIQKKGDPPAYSQRVTLFEFYFNAGSCSFLYALATIVPPNGIIK